MLQIRVQNHNIRAYILLILSFLLLTPAQSKVDIGLTDYEKEWIKNNPELIVGYDADLAPFEWFDQEFGFTGLSAEYIRYIEEVTGLHITAQQNERWVDTYAKCERGEIDLVTAVIRSDERAKIINFSNPYHSTPLSYVTHKNSNLSLNKPTTKTYNIGYTKGYAIGELLKTAYPHLNPIGFDQVEDGLRAVNEGRLDAFGGSPTIFSYIIESKKLDNLKIRGTFKLIPEIDVCIGSRKGLAPLNDIINKAIDKIPADELFDIYSSWVSSEHRYNTKLSALEKEWIKTHSKIQCYIGNTKPYHYWDNGAKGIFVDVLNKIASDYNFEIEYIHSTSLDQAIEDIKFNGKVGMLPIHHFRI